MRPPDLEKTHVVCSAYFPKRTRIFGQWVNGHSLPDRAINRARSREIVEFARCVNAVGGVFYMDGKKYEYVRHQNGECILMRDYINPVHAQRYREAARHVGGATARSEARTVAPQAAGGQEGFTCLVTRKVSLTVETKTDTAA